MAPPPDVHIATSASRYLALPLTNRQLGLMLQLPVLMMIGGFLLLFDALWGMQSMVDAFRQPAAGLLLLAAYPAGIVIHELLHGAAFAFMGAAPLRAIRFGTYKLTAYCQCDAPVSATSFRSSIALPGLALGVVPAIAALMVGNGWMLMFAALMTSAALGDALILWTLRGVPRDARVMYRPDMGRYEITLR